MINLTEQVIKRVLWFSENSLPDNIIHSAKRCLLDYCGVLLAGASENTANSQKILSLSKEIGNAGSNVAFGLNSTVDVYTAVSINSFNAHFEELDDGHRYGMLHLGSSIITAALAASECKNTDNLTVLKAIVCGYDVSIALAGCMQPDLKLKGYHATGVCCVIGAAMAWAVIMGYDRQQVSSTLAAAATSAAGLLEMIDGRSEMKPYNISQTTASGVLAAVWGAAGINGPEDVIGGRRGFLSVLSTKERLKDAEDRPLFPDGNYAIEEIYTKPYAACRHCHPPIEAVLNIRKKNRWTDKSFINNAVKKIEIVTYTMAIKGHDHIEIKSVQSAKMSIPYSVSAALLLGKYGMDAYEDIILQDDSINDCMKKILFSADPEMDRNNPQKRSAEVKIYLESGEVFSDRVDYPRGEPENQMTDKDMEDKFKELARFSGKTDEETQKIINLIWDYDNSVETVIDHLR
ncbi:MAG: MmgE/PrpD family protein [Lachnospiraceae bacterium]|nr:MmgE/PrpD family protein [Lachnospiraceae bacterium]